MIATVPIYSIQSDGGISGIVLTATAHSRPQSPNVLFIYLFLFLINERVALGPSKNIFFFIGCRKPDALKGEKCYASAHLSLLPNTEQY